MDDKKKRLLVIVLFGVAAIAAVLLLTQPDASTPQSAPPSAALPSPVPPNVVVPSTPPALPKGTTGGSLAMRDIFSPPAEYAAFVPSPTRSAAPGGSGSGQTFSAGPAPVLTGVISGEGTQVAILRQGTISRSYRVGQSTGAYRVASIGARSVTLDGPGGRVVLTIGQ
jgi:hypothetical protein